MFRSLDTISATLSEEQKVLLEPARKKLFQSLEALDKVAKIPTNPLPTQMRVTNLVEIGEQVVKRFQRAAEEDDILLTADFSSSEILAYADPSQMDGVFDKLITHALRNSPHGGQVFIRIDKMIDGQVHTMVRNTQADIDTHQLPALNSQGKNNNSLTTKTSNGGQTLSQVKEVIHAHGGKVWVEATAGQGSVLHFTLLPPA